MGAEEPARHDTYPGTVPDDLLATADMTTVGALRPRGPLPRVGVALGRPLAYALPPAHVAGATLLLCFPFDLEELPTGCGYRQVELEVLLDDEDLRALDLHPGGGRVGSDGARVTASGLGGHRPRWTFRAPHTGTTLSPDGRWAQAVLASPAPLAEITGRVRVRGVIEHALLGGTRGEAEVRTREDVPFRLSGADIWTGAALVQPNPGPGTWALVGSEDAGPQHDRLPPGRRHLCLAVDIEKYSARGNADMIRLQRALLRVVRAACARAAVDWDTCGRQAQGDGYLLVLPPDTDDTRAVPLLMQGLTEALATVNREPRTVIRMRAAFHHGIVHEGDSGYAGSAIVELFRVLDSRPLRTLLADDPSTHLVVAFPDRTYQDLVVHGYAGLSPEGFIRTDVRVKHFTGVAWIRSQRPDDRGTGDVRAPLPFPGGAAGGG